jgi:hypothetical protein
MDKYFSEVLEPPVVLRERFNCSAFQSSSFTSVENNLHAHELKTRRENWARSEGGENKWRERWHTCKRNAFSPAGPWEVDAG